MPRGRRRRATVATPSPPEVTEEVAAVIERQAEESPQIVERFMGVMSALQKTVESATTGVPLNEVEKTQIKQMVQGQEVKSEIISNLVLAKDYERLYKFMEARDVLEDAVIEASRRADLSGAEKIALLKYFSDESKFLAAKVNASSSSLARDMQALFDKIDTQAQANERALQEQLAGTSPQGREVVRRVLYTLNGALRKGEQLRDDDA